MSINEMILILTVLVFIIYWAFVNIRSLLSFYFDKTDMFKYFHYEDYIKNNYTLRVINFLMKLFLIIGVIVVTYLIYKS
jgi:hypothetical protein